MSARKYLKVDNLYLLLFVETILKCEILQRKVLKIVHQVNNNQDFMDDPIFGI